MMVAALATLGLVATACVPEGQPQQDDDSGWTLNDTGPDSGTDSGTDVGPDGGDVEEDTGPPDREPTPVTFEMVNTTDQPIRYMPKTGCGALGSEWLTLQKDGERLQGQSTCGSCNCEDVEGGQPCAICDCAAPVATELAPGESMSWQWDGQVRQSDTVDGQHCTRPAIPDEGTMQAKFCWEASDEIQEPGPGGLDNPTCETVDFEYGTDRKVTKEIEETPIDEPQPTTFQIHNETNSPLKIQPPSSCEAGSDTWVQLRDERGRFKMSTWCGECQCSQISEGEGCAVCAAVCQRPQPKTLAPGETATYEWSGKAYRPDRKHDRSCVREEIPRVGKRLDATFCWRDADAVDFPDAAQTCQRVSFAYGQDRNVAHTVGSDEPEEPSKTTFRLVNDTNGLVRYQKSEGCRSPAWLEFADDAIEMTKSPCGVCQCEMVEKHGSCPVCAAASCIGPKIGQLEPGESVEWTWSGYTYKRDTVDEQTCHRQVVPRRGRDFKTKFCFERGGGETGSGKLSGEECYVRGFGYGEETTVVHRASDE